MQMFFFYTHEETLKPVFHPRASCAAACAMCACLCIQTYLLVFAELLNLLKKKKCPGSFLVSAIYEFIHKKTLYNPYQCKANKQAIQAKSYGCMIIFTTLLFLCLMPN